MKLTCERCGKRLSRKTARLIDGKVLCSACLFAPAPPYCQWCGFAKPGRGMCPDCCRFPAQVGRSGEAGETAFAGSTVGEHAVREADAPNPESGQ